MAGPISSTSGVAAGLQTLQPRTPQSNNQGLAENPTATDTQAIENDTILDIANPILDTESILEQASLQDLEVNGSLNTSEAIDLADILEREISSSSLSIANTRPENLPLLLDQTL
jgi:hypothetical protein